MTGDVLEAVPRNLVEIEMLLVRDANGKVWEFATEGPIGIDAAHLLVHRDIGAGVEVIYLEKDGRLSYRRRSRGFKSQEWLDFFVPHNLGMAYITLENGSKAGIGTRLKKLQSSARTSGPTPVSQ